MIRKFTFLICVVAFLGLIRPVFAAEELSSLRNTQHVGLQVGALSLLMMEAAKGVPLLELNIPVGEKIFIGPQAQFIRTQGYGTHSTHESVGLKGHYFFGKNFETGPAVSAVVEVGKTYGQGLEFDSTLTAKGIDYENKFSHSAIYLSYFWYSKFATVGAGTQLLVNASFSAGVGYTHNTHCKNDEWCGSDGSHSGVAWSGEGWITPDLAVRLGISF